MKLSTIGYILLGLLVASVLVSAIRIEFYTIKRDQLQSELDQLESEHSVLEVMIERGDAI